MEYILRLFENQFPHTWSFGKVTHKAISRSYKVKLIFLTVNYKLISNKMKEISGNRVKFAISKAQKNPSVIVWIFPEQTKQPYYHIREPELTIIPEANV